MRGKSTPATVRCETEQYVRTGEYDHTHSAWPGNLIEKAAAAERDLVQALVLLDIDFRKRETFAYACEAYAWICERGRDRRTRIALAGEYAALCSIPDERVDPSEVVMLVRTACTARSGWKVILAGCAPKRAVRQQLDVA